MEGWKSGRMEQWRADYGKFGRLVRDMYKRMIKRRIFFSLPGFKE
jgi:hypothetical protein